MKKFITMLVQEALNCHIYGSDGKESTGPSKESKATNGSEKSTKNGKKFTSKTSSSKKKPLCLWDEHKKEGIRPFLRHCKECPKDVKDRLFEEHRDKNRDAAKRTTDDQKTDTTSVVFTAVFGERHRANVLR